MPNTQHVGRNALETDHREAYVLEFLDRAHVYFYTFRDLRKYIVIINEQRGLIIIISEMKKKSVNGVK
jgi:hypothetical protein